MRNHQNTRTNPKFVEDEKLPLPAIPSPFLTAYKVFQKSS